MVKPAKGQTVVGSNSRQPTLRNSTQPAFSFTQSDFLFMHAHWLARITRYSFQRVHHEVKHTVLPRMFISWTNIGRDHPHVFSSVPICLTSLKILHPDKLSKTGTIETPPTWFHFSTSPPMNLICPCVSLLPGFSCQCFRLLDVYNKIPKLLIHKQRLSSIDSRLKISLNPFHLHFSFPFFFFSGKPLLSPPFTRIRNSPPSLLEFMDITCWRSHC